MFAEGVERSNFLWGEGEGVEKNSPPGKKGVRNQEYLGGT